MWHQHFHEEHLGLQVMPTTYFKGLRIEPGELTEIGKSYELTLQELPVLEKVNDVF